MLKQQADFVAGYRSGCGWQTATFALGWSDWPRRNVIRGAPLADELARLEEIVRRLEADDVDLDAALTLFEEGVARLRSARERLAAAELKVQAVLEEAGGDIRLTDLDELRRLSVRQLPNRSAAGGARVDRHACSTIGLSISRRRSAGETGRRSPMRSALRENGFALRCCSRAYRALGGTSPGIAGVAAAVETVHAYSLVHDDLPCMDNDDLRRGRPTAHRAFDVPTATRVGFLLVPVAALAPGGCGARSRSSSSALGKMAEELFEAGGI